MEQSVKERLTIYREYKKISQAKFEKAAKLSNGYLNSLRHAPSAIKLQSIIEAFPDLNRTWLLTGEGSMLVGEQSTPTTALPYFEHLPVSAGRVVQYPDIVQQQATGTIDLPQTRGAEFVFPVVGMSMKPTIEEGEVIGVAHVERYETTNADRIYMIVTTDHERMIKRILKYDAERGVLTLGSDNPNFPNTELCVEYIIDIYKVVFHMRIETL